MTNSKHTAERAIAKAAIADLLAAGFVVSLFDGEAYPVKKSSNAKEIFAAMFSVDEETLIARDASGTKIGVVNFVYGNDGYDAMAEYSEALHAVLTGARTEADKREAQLT